MIRFAQLYNRIDATTKTNEKIAAMVDYFQAADPADAAWAVYFLSGNKLKRLVPTKMLRIWAAERAGIPDWLFDESYQAVGDLAETISLIVPTGQATDDATLSEWITDRLTPLRGMDESEQKQAVIDIWQATPSAMRLVVMKLITGAFRVGVSKRLVTRAIAKQSGVPAEVIAHRLMGDWEPTADFYQRVIDPEVTDTLVSQPYPFCLAHPIDVERGPEMLGECHQFVAEWKWDGIRGQLIRRDRSGLPPMVKARARGVAVCSTSASDRAKASREKVTRRSAGRFSSVRLAGSAGQGRSGSPVCRTSPPARTVVSQRRSPPCTPDRFDRR